MSRLFEIEPENEATELFKKIEDLAKEYKAKIIDHSISTWLEKDCGFKIKLIIEKEDKNEKKVRKEIQMESKGKI